ncbi:MAG TPA: bifunctional alpha,alpha-trehalose-phosphate synthase (UDP-forming)/trehalose-phosphatase [bacterium]|nr:bifunctional alpha,alpha-trehalose-phosphate synthase (UDP-forming)/trehalose-phosphatase [bacterium]
MPDFAERLERITGTLAGRTLILVSNREPYLHRHEDGRVVVDRPAGGLVAALDPVMQAVSGTWIAWGAGDADAAVADGSGRIRVPPEAPAYTLRRVQMTPSQVRSYYYGYANQALWPLCHLAMDKARFRRGHWKGYQDVNRLFADATLDEAGRSGEPIVWLQDYHLALCPRYLRQAIPELFVTHFWHIPWPGWDAFQICPQRGELLDGLLGNDLIGFQRPRFADNFMDCVGRELGARVDREEGTIEYQGRIIHVGAFPISVDYAAIDAAARSAECEEWMERFTRRYGLDSRAMILGVDRLDYTKGIPERLRAFDVFLRRHRQFRGRVVFVQKSAPSRTQIRAYRELQDEVEGQIASINGKYGTADWQPVVYLPRPLPPAGMAALYRLAGVCIVSSLQDGMNLVAKEYIAAQVDRSGVLLLSELTGARRELPWALSINPFDREGVADAIRRALAMPPARRRERMDHMRVYVADHDIYEWVADCTAAAGRVLGSRGRTRWLADHLEDIRDRVRVRPPVLLLDFDGTLAPIVGEPARAAMPASTSAALQRILRGGVPVAIVSGRRLDDVRRRVGIDGVTYIGNHGLEVAGPGFAWVHPEAEAARSQVAVFTRRVRERLRDVPGVIIEDKQLTAAVHYRAVPRPRIEDVRMAVLEEASALASGNLVVHAGKEYLEVRPAVSWGKGTAALAELRRIAGEEWPSRVCPIYIGDDRTDEDAFLVLRGPAVTVRVGHSSYQTAAEYLVPGVEEVSRFLSLIPQWVRPRGDERGGGA